MKTAKERNKVSLTISEVEKRIDEVESGKNENGVFKIFYPHWVYVSDDIKLQLMKYGYKVYTDNWDGIMINALIIEW